MSTSRYALLSVFNKSGILSLAQGLVKGGFTLLSSGGTGRVLADEGIPFTSVSDFTGQAEILEGRVKTLHPKIFAGLLARPISEHRAVLEASEIPEIDLVVCNLYPFRNTVNSESQSTSPDESNVIESIDIGGPSLIRAAAKNFERTMVVIDPADYDATLAMLTAESSESERIQEMFRWRKMLAGKAFAHTAAFDCDVSNYFASPRESTSSGGVAAGGALETGEIVGANNVNPLALTLTPSPRLALHSWETLRYGENPHQEAAYFGAERDHPPFEQLQGKSLSYNNIVDADAAWRLVQEFSDPTVIIVKHTNPCGAASANDIQLAYTRALASDPVSAFGGIVAVNRPIDAALAALLKAHFFEVIMAPAFDDVAQTVLAKKKNCRLLKMDGGWQSPHSEIRSAFGGYLVQSYDEQLECVSHCTLATTQSPSEDMTGDLDFAWALAKHVKSNAIVIVKSRQLVGAGAGQMSRVDAAKLAILKARQGDLSTCLGGACAASDAFFPFRDGLDVLAAAGIKSVIQPGGSKRDQEVIDAANEHGLAMVFTGHRHFRH